MRVSAHVTFERVETCGPCFDADGQGFGKYAYAEVDCYCSDYEERLEVVGDVEEGIDRAYVHILTVTPVATGRAWSAIDVRCMTSVERTRMEEALVFAHDSQQAPSPHVTAELASVVNLLETSVRLALEMGADKRRILNALRQVRHTAMGVKNNQEAA